MSDLVEERRQYGLALHTTTPQLGLAIASFSGERRSQTWDLGRELSAVLHAYLVDFLKPQHWSDLAFLAVAKGPGGFTGTRLGVVTARVLAQQLNIPLFAISTLAAVARSHSPTRDRLLAVEMNARRQQLFVALYRYTDRDRLTVELPDTVMDRQQWQERLANLNEVYELIPATSDLGTTATSILALAYQDWLAGKRPHWSEALPFYGQHPVD
jgi:tRNA threonylcarbamoyl adenosine modification protein YeaZ